MSSRQRISARDYKHGGGRRSRFAAGDFRRFGYGLATGLAVALAVFIFDHRGAVDDVASVRAEPVAKEAEPSADESGEPVEQYDFYNALKYEVVLPEEGRVRRDEPAVPITRPGTYMIQAGSFINESEALRRQQTLSKLGIESIVQRVAIDADVKHRVRIGPIKDLARLNQIRNQLRTADIDLLLSSLPE